MTRLFTITALAALTLAMQTPRAMAGNASRVPTVYWIIDLHPTPESLGFEGNSNSLTESEANAINAAGQIVGRFHLSDSRPNYPERRRAVLWANGTAHNLSDRANQAVSINASGDVILVGGGTSSVYSDGEEYLLPVPQTALPTGINASGQIAVNFAAGRGSLAKRLTEGFFQALDFAAQDTKAFGINDNGWIVGAADGRAFLWKGPADVFPDLGTLGGSQSEARAINNKPGVVVGASRDESGRQHAFRWTERIGMEDLGTLPNESQSVALAINNHGAVVGTSFTRNAVGQETSRRAFLHTPEQGMVDLNTLINPALGFTLVEARGINDDGAIVGCGLRNGEKHAFLMRPMRLPALFVGGR
jgi:probable HAF family extracellular repeat protein